MNKRLVWGIAAAAMGLAAVAWAQAPMTAGEVTKVDKSTGRLTLKHGEIKHMDMPPMTMAFRVSDARLLDSVVVGDRVRFSVERVDGQYTVTQIAKAP